ncbi:hypothetical protein HON22_00865 [Candidatus Peregrinibacteria bacterium]|nr:hypothetical protein [Candidatus Peregrinibacteria bacterium]
MKKESAPLSVFPPYNLLTQKYNELNSAQFEHFNEVVQVYNYIRENPEQIREKDEHAAVLGGLRRYLRLCLLPYIAKQVGVQSLIEGDPDKEVLADQRQMSYNKWIIPYLNRFHDKIIEVENPYPQNELDLAVNH